jgi:transposase
MEQCGMLQAMRPQGTPQQLQKRRTYAIQLWKSGKLPATIARAVSASRSSVGRWIQSYQHKGKQGLAAQPIPGRPASLSAKQTQKLERLLLQGPLAAGYQTDLWTLGRITKLIEQHFGVAYHPGHVWKVLRQMDWSCQKPERRALQRDEVAIAHWKRYVWPQIKKKPRA